MSSLEIFPRSLMHREYDRLGLLSLADKRPYVCFTLGTRLHERYRAAAFPTKGAGLRNRRDVLWLSTTRNPGENTS